MRYLWLVTVVLANEPKWVQEIELHPPMVAPTVAEVGLDATDAIGAALISSTAETHSGEVTLQRSAVSATPLADGPSDTPIGGHRSAFTVRQALAIEPVPAIVGTVPMSPDSPNRLVAAIYRSRPATEALAGREFSLHDLLRHVDGPNDRLRVITAYWVLGTRVARYHLALDSVAELEQLCEVTAEDEPILAAAIVEARARSQKNRADTLHSQHRLVDRVGLASPPSRHKGLPLPVDFPFVGAYPVYLAVPAGPSRQRVERLCQSLVDRQRDVEEQADLVSAVHAQFVQTATHYEARRSGIQVVIDAQHQLHLQRESFLASVLQYNWEIGKYVVVVTGRRAALEAVVAMLLPDDLNGLDRAGGPTHTVSREEPVANASTNRLRRLHDRDAVPLLPTPESREE